MADTQKRTETPSQSGTNGTTSTPIESAEERIQVQKLYDIAKKELRELLQRKKQADKDLAVLETQIYKLEGNYLEDTQQGGNIVRGFDGYLKGMVNSRKMQFSESDRLFSLSSVSYSETAQPDKEAKGSTKKRRKTIDEGASSDEDGNITPYASSHKRARVTYAD
ncbi:Chromatin modification-related protein eaf6 [Taphrina deformans PYCC 5710]|uniref:Chromatin modification-related protein EAF6 n=1 Tax=Taphrina deformans (strain PYCC 5710 / ATCC 11124 / CBS 356.35 / IMI 108563 / JCM 9778 / NBRC 8474) TaxID=1097556 RepID=R4XFF1_TAPDE|nr:Chromatin modification-related protein eaf6 [Taphrina deformans PYCC 5710]|eukprot:CCG83186.1 Chromatin modification-related protein eaf6 [Taphrina deformans PYCC 5710]